MGIRDVVCFYFREDIYYHIKNTILRSITVHKIDFKPIKKKAIFLIEYQAGLSDQNGNFWAIRLKNRDSL